MKKVLSLMVSILLFLGCQQDIFQAASQSTSGGGMADKNAISMVATAGENGLVVKENGELWMIGNEYAKMGEYSEKVKISAKKMLDNVKTAAFSNARGGYCVMAIKKNGELWMWGDNTYGQLGIDYNTYFYKELPVKVMNNVKAVSGGGEHTVALKQNGEVWLWGWNASGRIGVGREEESEVLPPTKIMDHVKAIETGWANTYVIKENAELWGWGKNWNGALGVEKTRLTNRPVKILSSVKKVVSSDFDKCCYAIKENGELWQWGQDTSTDTYKPKKMLSGIVDANAYAGVHMALNEEGGLYTWGRTYIGQWISRSPGKVLTDIKLVCKGRNAYVLRKNGDLLDCCFVVDRDRDRVSRTPINVMKNIKLISSTEGFTLAVTKQNQVLMWEGDAKKSKEIKLGK